MASAKSGSQPATNPPGSGLTSDIASARRHALVAGHTGDTEGALELTRHPESAVRVAALGALGATGSLETRLVVDALDDESWTVRRRACELAGRIVTSGDQGDIVTSGDQGDIVTSGDQGDIVTRRDQGDIVTRGDQGDIAVNALFDRLVETLADRNPLVAEAAAWALGELTPQINAAGRARGVDSLGVMTTEHGDPLCREAAVAALGAIGDPSSIEPVLAALGDKPPIRRRAAVALAAFEDPRVDAALNDCLTDRDWQVRQAAEDILGRMD